MFDIIIIAPLIGLAGGVGSCIRYALSFANKKVPKQELSKDGWFPLGTLLANCLGCALIPFALHIANFIVVFYLDNVIGSTSLQGSLASNSDIGEYTHMLSIVIAVGLCGGISTLSTAMTEAAVFLRARQFDRLTIYLLLTILVPLAIATVLMLLLL